MIDSLVASCHSLIYLCLGYDDLQEDLDTAYTQALQGYVLDVIPLPNALDQQDEYILTPYSQFRVERRLQFEEYIKATCQAQFKAHRHFGLKMYWTDMTTQDGMFPNLTQIDWIWRRSYLESQLYNLMDGNSPCIKDVSPISFEDACMVCGCDIG